MHPQFQGLESRLGRAPKPNTRTPEATLMAALPHTSAVTPATEHTVKRTNRLSECVGTETGEAAGSTGFIARRNGIRNVT